MAAAFRSIDPHVEKSKIVSPKERMHRATRRRRLAAKNKQLLGRYVCTGVVSSSSSSTKRGPKNTRSKWFDKTRKRSRAHRMIR